MLLVLAIALGIVGFFIVLANVLQSQLLVGIVLGLGLMQLSNYLASVWAAGRSDVLKGDDH